MGSKQEKLLLSPLSSHLGAGASTEGQDRGGGLAQRASDPLGAAAFDGRLGPGLRPRLHRGGRRGGEHHGSCQLSEPIKVYRSRGMGSRQKEGALEHEGRAVTCFNFPFQMQRIALSQDSQPEPPAFKRSQALTPRVKRSLCSPALPQGTYLRLEQASSGLGRASRSVSQKVDRKAAHKTQQVIIQEGVPHAKACLQDLQPLSRHDSGEINKWTLTGCLEQR